MSSQLDKVKQRLSRKAAALARFLSSPDGAEIVEILEEEFVYGELFDNDPCKTAYNLGGRDVVVYLRQLKRIGEKDA